jgi:isopentenyl diphosphate isomerase/L-lactate dehydrogenase-like FMN-dependent dehydrogenase
MWRFQAAVMSRQMDAGFNWDDFSWLRNLWPRKLLVKGILRLDDDESLRIGAALTTVQKTTPYRPLDGHGEVCVLQHDKGIAAAEFED